MYQQILKKNPMVHVLKHINRSQEKYLKQSSPTCSWYNITNLKNNEIPSDKLVYITEKVLIHIFKKKKKVADSGTPDTS